MGIFLLIVLVSSVWVYFDARSIGAKKGLMKGFFDLGPAGWFWVCLLLWIIGFPSYLMKRGTLKELAAQQITEPNAAPQTPKTNDVLAQLEKLGELKKNGIVTDEEFAMKKKELLNG